MSDQFTPGYVGNISLRYGVTGRAAHITLKVVLLAASETTAYGPSGTGLEETEAGVYDIEQFTYPSVQGRYRSYWYDDGVFIPGAFDEFEITSTPLAPLGAPTGGDLCTIADVKVAMEMSQGDTSLDTRIQTEVTAASGEIMALLERELVPQTSSATRRFRVPLDPYGAQANAPIVNLAPYDLRTVAALTLHPEQSVPIAVPSSSYSLGPLPSKFGSYTRVELDPFLSFYSATALRFNYALIDIQGSWGIWTSPPQWVREAVALTVKARIRQTASQGVFAENVDDGSVASPPVPAYSIAPATLRALAPLRRWMP